MGWNIKEMSVPALKDLLSMIECAIKRTEIDSNDIEKYKHLLQQKKDVKAELELRGK